MTDRKPSRGAARMPLSPLEWRLYLVAVLAGVYLFTWRAISGDPSATSAPARAPAAQPTARWLDELPAARRPALAIPAGWRLASRSEQAPSPRVVRAPASRPLRVRTRSS